MRERERERGFLLLSAIDVQVHKIRVYNVNNNNQIMYKLISQLIYNVHLKASANMGWLILPTCQY